MRRRTGFWSNTHLLAVVCWLSEMGGYRSAVSRKPDYISIRGHLHAYVIMTRSTEYRDEHDLRAGSREAE